MPIESRPDRPALPNCCCSAARVPGKPTLMTASSPATSMPSSSALVLARPSRSPLLREIAAAIGCDASGQLRVDLVESPLCSRCHGLGAASRSYERERSHLADDEIRQQLTGLGRGRAAYRGLGLVMPGQERRLPERDRPPRVGGCVVDDRYDVEPGQPAGE